MTRLPTWPLALFTTACVVQPWEPSATIEMMHEEQVPEADVWVQLPPRKQTMDRWMLSADQPWSAWSKATLLSVLDEQPSEERGSFPDVRELPVVQNAESAASALSRVAVPSDTLWIVDLRGAASVAFAAVLSGHIRVAPVLTFNNWPAEHEVIPAEETLSALLLFSPQLPDGTARAMPVFLLDAWRLEYAGSPVEDATDNRYMLGPQDFPTAEQLAGLGIRRVVYVVENRVVTSTERDDLHATFTDWAAAGVGITMIDLGDLIGEPPIETYIAEHPYRVVPRTTIVMGDWLNVSSPGGFGGYEGPRSATVISRGGWFGGGG